MAQHCRDRLAARRQFIDDRHVKVTVDRHCQRARNRRGGHHQHMGRCRAVLAPQAGALSDTEAVLLVDDGEAQVVELHGILNQGMGADKDL